MNDSNIRQFPGPTSATVVESDADAHDLRLVERAQSGDLDAFNEIVTRHERAVYSVCVRLLRDTSRAEDVTQDAFIRAWTAIGTFRGGLVRPWLMRIATNRSYDILRSQQRRPASSLDAELFETEPQWTTQSDHEVPESYATRSELSSTLEAALGELPEDQRVAIVLSDVHGYGYEDISTATGVAVGTVKSRISRGRSALRDILRGDEQNRELFERYVRLTQQSGESA